MPGRQVDPPNVEGRTFEAATVQLLSPVRYHLPHQPVALVFGIQQDELQQPVHLLPAGYQDRRILLPIPNLGLAQLLAGMLDGERVPG
jgi:hypothetical protein